MNKAFEKIIEKLESMEKVFIKGNSHNVAAGISRAIEIVKHEAEQYNNGWIPCSERLPKENGYYYVTQIVKSVSTGKKIAIEKAYVEFSKGEWRRAKHLEVIAWLDIETYQPKGE